MTAEIFDLARHGVNGGVDKVVTIQGGQYRLTRLLVTEERETEYAAVNVSTGLARFVIKVYGPGLTEEARKQDAEGRLVSYLEIKARGLLVVRADVLDASCGPVRMQRTLAPDETDEAECATLLARAYDQLKRGELEDAIETCDEIAARNPRHTDAMAIHAQCLLSRSDASGGMDLVLEALRYEPNDERLYWLAAQCALARRHVHVAITLLSSEIGRAPGDIYAAEELVEILLHDLQVEAADAVVAKYRARLSLNAASKYFAEYDAAIDHARTQAAHFMRVLALQEKGDWRGAWHESEPLARSDHYLVRLNRATCGYHLNEALDLRELLVLVSQGTAMVRSVALTLALLGAARQGDVQAGTLAAKAVAALFSNPMDLSGVPIWTTWDRGKSGRPEPVISALSALERSSADQRELFTRVAQLYSDYAQQIGPARST